MFISLKNYNEDLNTGSINELYLSSMSVKKAFIFGGAIVPIDESKLYNYLKECVA